MVPNEFRTLVNELNVLLGISEVKYWILTDEMMIVANA